MSKKERHFVTFEGFVLDQDSGMLYRDGINIPLTPKAVKTLQVFIENRGQLLSKEALLKAIWPDTFVEEGNLSFNIHSLRKALNEGGTKERFIETVPRRGYRFIPEVKIETERENDGSSETPDPVPSAPPKPAARLWLWLACVVILIAAGLKLSWRTSADLEPALVRLTNHVADDGRPDISPNGRYIVFVSNRDGGKGQIYLMNADGSHLRNLTNNLTFDDDSPAWSPDGQHIAFQSKRRGAGSELYIMDANGVDPTALAPGGRAAWSPDGKLLAFQRVVEGHTEIFTIPSSGGEARRVTFAADFAGDPAWSPDSSRIVFTGAVSGHLQIQTMSPDGTDLVTLTACTCDNSLPSWSPDGRQIAFNSNRDREDAIYLMEADGTLPRRITESRSHEAEASWSRDGRNIFFESARDGNLEIYRIRVPDNTDAAIRLTHDVATDRNPSWSPDGNWIAFESNRNGPWNLFVMDPSGGQVRKLTRGSASEQTPAWSPNGERIAFAGTHDGPPALFTMLKDGSDIQKVADGGSWPAWSPSGTQICFTREHQIWVVSAAGGPAQTIGAGETCSWSRDGKSLTFDRDDIHQREIYNVIADGGEPFCVTRNGKTNGGPAWNPAGTHIAFNSNRDGGTLGIFIMNDDGTGQRRLTGRGYDEHPAWSPDGRWIAFTSQRDGNNEIYKVAVP